MIQLVAIITANTSEERDSIIELVINDLDAVHNEVGCQTYDVFTSGSRRIVFIEQWESNEALKAHAGNTSFTSLQTKLAELNLSDTLQILPIIPAK